VSHVTTQLTAYLDGALEDTERGAVEAHLSSCPDCRAQRDGIARALLVLRALPPPPGPSAQFEQRFHARLARERARPAGLLARLPWRWLAPAAAAGALAAVLVGIELRDQNREAFLASHLELFESYELVASVGQVDDADAGLVAHLHELEGEP
jgi:anti-sigma factor RsiW